MEPKSGDSVAPGRGHRERAVPFRNDLGAIEGWYGTNTDIEDRKRAEALVAGENRLLQRLAEGDSLDDGSPRGRDHAHPESPPKGHEAVLVWWLDRSLNWTRVNASRMRLRPWPDRRNIAV